MYRCTGFKSTGYKYYSCYDEDTCSDGKREFLMKQIHITNNEAPKLGGTGTLKYQLWVDASGSLYVKISENSDGGTFSPWRFPVAKYASGRNSTGSLGQLVGLDAEGKKQDGKNSNDDAFFKAVLVHLLDVITPA